MINIIQNNKNLGEKQKDEGMMDTGGFWVEENMFKHVTEQEKGK